MKAKVVEIERTLVAAIYICSINKINSIKIVSLPQLNGG